jgi:hypothetical protein
MVKKTRRQRVPNDGRARNMLNRIEQFFLNCEALHASTSNGQIHVTRTDRQSSRTDNEGIRCPGAVTAERRYNSKLC